MTGFLKNFKIRSYYQYLLYLCGFILVLSLIVEFKGIENSYVRCISIWIIGGSILVWILEKVMMQINKFRHEINLRKRTDSILNQEDTMLGYYKEAFILGIVNISIHLVFWLIIIFKVFIGKICLNP